MGCIPSAGRKRLSTLSACMPGTIKITCSRLSGYCQRNRSSWTRSASGLDQSAQFIQILRAGVADDEIAETVMPTVGVKRFLHSRRTYRRVRLFCVFSLRVLVGSTVRVIRESFVLSRAKQ